MNAKKMNKYLLLVITCINFSKAGLELTNEWNNFIKQLTDNTKFDKIMTSKMGDALKTNDVEIVKGALLEMIQNFLNIISFISESPKDYINISKDTDKKFGISKKSLIKFAGNKFYDMAYFNKIGGLRNNEENRKDLKSMIDNEKFSELIDFDSEAKLEFISLVKNGEDIFNFTKEMDEAINKIRPNNDEGFCKNLGVTFELKGENNFECRDLFDSVIDITDHQKNNFKKILETFGETDTGKYWCSTNNEELKFSPATRRRILV